MKEVILNRYTQGSLEFQKKAVFHEDHIAIFVQERWPGHPGYSEWFDPESGIDLTYEEFDALVQARRVPR